MLESSFTRQKQKKEKKWRKETANINRRTMVKNPEDLFEKSSKLFSSSSSRPSRAKAWINGHFSNVKGSNDDDDVDVNDDDEDADADVVDASSIFFLLSSNAAKAGIPTLLPHFRIIFLKARILNSSAKSSASSDS